MTDTNRITREIASLLHPQAALIVYRTEDEDRYFLELRTIGADGKMGAGHPVTYEFMNEITRTYSETNGGIPFGRVPEKLLFCDTRRGSETYVWYNPPQRRMMYFAPGLNIENAEYNLPGIIYRVRASGLEVYAYKGETPSDKTELFEAPFFNVTGAAVCLGQAKIVKPDNPTYDRLLEYWEKKFWLTEFSHLGGRGNPTRSNLVLVTKAAKDKPFDLEELKPLKNLKLKDILR